MTTRREFIGGTAAAAAMLVGQRAHAAQARPLMVSVITCPRPGNVSYVEGTLAIVDADLPASVSRLLVCDGPWTASSQPPASWLRINVGDRPRRHGPLPDNKAPGWIAIQAAEAAGADLLFLEDDIRPLAPQLGDVPGTYVKVFTSMATHVVPPGVDFSSFFASRRKPGLYDAGVFGMSQAIKIPHRSLTWLVRAPSIEQLTWLNVVGVDLAIAHLGRAAGWRFEQTSNLVEHIGLWSAAHPKGFRA